MLTCIPRGLKRQARTARPGTYFAVRGTGSCTSEAMERAERQRGKPAPFRPDPELIREANERLGLRSRERPPVPPKSSSSFDGLAAEAIKAAAATAAAAAARAIMLATPIDRPAPRIVQSKFVAAPTVFRLTGPTQLTKRSEPDYPIFVESER